MCPRSEDKVAWVRSDLASTYEERKRIVSTALEEGYASIVIKEGDEGLEKLGRFDAIVFDEGEFLLNGASIGRYLEVHSSDDLEDAQELKGGVQYLVIAARDWKVIPLENLIAEFQDSETRLLACTSDPEEAELFLETLEVGTDGIVIEPSSPEAVLDFPSLSSLRGEGVELTEATVTEISGLPSGDRVCVDTCSLLEVGEGMLVGSQSSCLFLIASESQKSEYVASRPFRVNAGAVHAYILTPGGKTRYLSEIESGDEVLAVNSKGASRSVIVGRSKIEKRPLLMIKAEADGEEFATIVQNAETIRLCTPERAVSVSELEEGQKVLVKLEKGGRHFGKSIEETISEK